MLASILRPHYYVPMFTSAQLEICNQQLNTFDVVQGAWEQESNGFEANAHHVLTHLVRTLVGKDFNNADIVRSDIAPDSVQYALRLGRWIGLAPADLPFKDEVAPRVMIRGVATRLGSLPWPTAAFAEATRNLAHNLHEFGHASTNEQARLDRKEHIGACAGMLLISADFQSNQYDFDLAQAFTERLDYLRNRFGIRHPQTRD
ncbi:MAG: hypothetical protein JWS12_225 [Candidatus Saccharibacteria bacterium]|nr:hypothetical protein [Candidatus Saccharibacteria bacterium]